MKVATKKNSRCTSNFNFWTLTIKFTYFSGQPCKILIPKSSHLKKEKKKLAQPLKPPPKPFLLLIFCLSLFFSKNSKSHSPPNQEPITLINLIKIDGKSYGDPLHQEIGEKHPFADLRWLREQYSMELAGIELATVFNGRGAAKGFLSAKVKHFAFLLKGDISAHYQQDMVMFTILFIIIG